MEFNANGTIKQELKNLEGFNPKTGCTTKLLVQTLPTRRPKLTKTQRKSMKAAQNETWQTSKKDKAMLTGYKNIRSLLARGNCGVQMA